MTNDLYKTDLLVLRKCPAAGVTWRMGSPMSENGRNTVRETPHEVSFTRDYYIGVYPVTQRQYERLTKKRPSTSYKADADYMTHPLDSICYDDLRGKATDGYDWPNDGHAVKPDGFFGLLRGHSGIDSFDLPTEARWEYACRAGCGNALYNGQDLESDPNYSARLKKVACFIYSEGTTANTETQKVGLRAPNDWGLYDTLGNIYELCIDWWAADYQNFDAEKGPTSGTERPRRGGAFNEVATNCRCAFRNSHAPSQVRANVGFRVACEAVVK